METKIYSALKQTYARLGLGETILKGQAAALNATGLVTDENLDAVVAAQKQFLEALQGGMDKRVAGALAKTKASRRKKMTSQGISISATHSGDDRMTGKMMYGDFKKVLITLINAYE